MSALLDEAPSIQTLRRTVAVNLFKLSVLGDEHEPSKPQTSALFDALSHIQADDLLSERNWNYWNSLSSQAAQPSKLRQLDEIVGRLITSKSPGSPFLQDFFLSLVRGGLADSLCKPTKSKHLVSVLRDRANSYSPTSPLHLHLDALELLEAGESPEGISVDAFRQIGALRILELLEGHWNPRHGQIYSTIASTKSRKYPDWEKVYGLPGGFHPPHVCKLLFSLAADPDFLTEEVLHIWALDLATASLAMYALAWTDRYATFGSRVSEEQIFWRALHTLLFDDQRLRFRPSITSAMALCQANWSLRSFKVLSFCRKNYRQQLYVLGVKPSWIGHIVSLPFQRTPIEYPG